MISKSEVIIANELHVHLNKANILVKPHLITFEGFIGEVRLLAMPRE